MDSVGSALIYDGSTWFNWFTMALVVIDLWCLWFVLLQDKSGTDEMSPTLQGYFSDPWLWQGRWQAIGGSLPQDLHLEVGENHPAHLAGKLENGSKLTAYTGTSRNQLYKMFNALLSFYGFMMFYDSQASLSPVLIRAILEPCLYTCRELVSSRQCV